ncbi:MAG: nitrate reductase cytochrome c-type subunit; periplasmic nitrate reductase electron transfer subunit [Gammaproteobacteria bacterium]|nr:nitrate reductase cytochrome c-type subunit; periplasmic nitrate reductase electron transfer subunit [Gammaproteobacteria bacterium]
MKRVIVATLAGVLALVFMTAASADVQSLRGAAALDAKANKVTKKKQKKMEGGFERAFKIAPPSIPHGIDKDRVSLNENTCLDKCHSEKKYEKEKAPKVGDSHYKNRDGKVLKSISSRRYFCQQCHTPQADTAPLVANTF